MKARKIDLRDYVPPGVEGPVEKIKVRQTLANLITHPGLKLSPKELIVSGILADTIEKSGQEVLVDKRDYETITKALDKIVPELGLGRAHYPLMDRVYNAPEIEVEAKDEPKQPEPEKK